MPSLSLLLDRLHPGVRAAPIIVIALILTPLAGSATIQAAPPQQTAPHRLLTDPMPNPHQEPTVLWFAATGHTLRGAFLDYWTHYGGLPQFGYPLTEEFVEPAGETTGKEPMTVQYFERNRFEHHPENAGTPYEVLLGSLGRDFHESDPPAAPLQSPDSRYFAPTGHNAYGPFLAYWEAHGGVFVHGYPITEAYYEQKNPTNGRSYLVQYFERSRFEYHPENAGTPYEILLGLLGTQLSEKKGYPYGWYPIYGHAADFSWVSGSSIEDPRMCPVCGCNTILYVADAWWYFVPGTSVHPYGRIWDEAKMAGLTDGLVAVFGHLDGGQGASIGCPTHVPGYVVEQFQTNPAQ